MKNSITINIGSKDILFSLIPLEFEQRDISSVFYNKKNKTLKETLEHIKYTKIKNKLGNKYEIYGDEKIGKFLKSLKENNNNDYLHFLNRNGDNSFCIFKISQYTLDKGIYCFIEDNKIKYVGRCIDSFEERINKGYGKIHPKNCFIDGQSTNCHINSLINQSGVVQVGIYTMNDKTNEEIKKLESSILKSFQLDWNIQKK